MVENGQNNHRVPTQVISQPDNVQGVLGPKFDRRIAICSGMGREQLFELESVGHRTYSINV